MPTGGRLDGSSRATAGGDADLAAVGALLAEPVRARILQALLDGRALPAGVLASEAGVAASTASGHLARLLDAVFIAVEQQGRHRYYRLAGAPVAEILELLAHVAPTAPIRSLTDRGHQFLADLALNSTATTRRALIRDCVDWTEQRHHLAGDLGARLAQRMFAAGWINPGPLRRSVVVSDNGVGALATHFGIDAARFR